MIKRPYLVMLRVVGAALWLWFLVRFISAIVPLHHQLQIPCEAEFVGQCNYAQLTPPEIQQIADAGISLQTYALYTVIIMVLTSLVFWVVGTFVAWKRSHTWFGLLTAYLMITFASAGPSLIFTNDDQSSLFAIITFFLTVPVYQAMYVFLLTFPNGRFWPRWSLALLPLIFLNTFFWVVPPEMPIQIENWPGVVQAVWLVVVFGAPIANQVYRYRRIYSPLERQQAKWLILGFSLVLVILLLSSISVALTNPDGLNQSPWEGLIVCLLYLPIPIATGIAVLRYRLWDIDIVINRLVVYSILTLLVIALYLGIALGLGTLFNLQGGNVMSLMTAAAIVILIQPLRSWLQGNVNRLMFGERDAPIAILKRLSERLEATASPDALLSTVTETLAQALKLPYVAVETSGQQIYSVYGAPVNDVGRFPLVYQTETLGNLIVGKRGPGEAFNSMDRRLLDMVAYQAGAALHAVLLTDDLRATNERLITTREEERRRIRRDLHDGLGPALAAQTLKLGAVRQMLATNVNVAADVIQEIEKDVQQMLVDIRQLIYDLRPPALDDLGLAGAVRDLAAGQSVREANLHINLDLPDDLPPLPAAIESAAYRIVQEALTNIVRHAGAQSISITMQSHEAKLVVCIEDDGCGIPPDAKGGVGLRSMRERAQEVGGLLNFETPVGGGTRLRVELPLR